MRLFSCFALLLLVVCATSSEVDAIPREVPQVDTPLFQIQMSQVGNNAVHKTLRAHKRAKELKRIMPSRILNQEPAAQHHHAKSHNHREDDTNHEDQGLAEVHQEHGLTDGQQQTFMERSKATQHHHAKPHGHHHAKSNHHRHANHEDQGLAEVHQELTDAQQQTFMTSLQSAIKLLKTHSVRAGVPFASHVVATLTKETMALLVAKPKAKPKAFKHNWAKPKNAFRKIISRILRQLIKGHKHDVVAVKQGQRNHAKTKRKFELSAWDRLRRYKAQSCLAQRAKEKVHLQQLIASRTINKIKLGNVCPLRLKWVDMGIENSQATIGLQLRNAWANTRTKYVAALRQYAIAKRDAMRLTKVAAKALGKFKAAIKLEPQGYLNICKSQRQEYYLLKRDVTQNVKARKNVWIATLIISCHVTNIKNVTKATKCAAMKRKSKTTRWNIKFGKFGKCNVKQLVKKWGPESWRPTTQQCPAWLTAWARNRAPCRPNQYLHNGKCYHKYRRTRATCTASGDPHLHPFSGPLFDVQQSGVFTAVKRGLFEVQTYHQPCGRVVRWHGVSTKYPVSCVRGMGVQLKAGMVLSASQRSNKLKLNGKPLSLSRDTWKRIKGTSARIMWRGGTRYRVDTHDFAVDYSGHDITISVRDTALRGKLIGYCGWGKTSFKGTNTSKRFPCKSCIRGGVHNSGLCECKEHWHGVGQNPKTLFPPMDKVGLAKWKARVMTPKTNTARFARSYKKCYNTLKNTVIGRYTLRIHRLNTFVRGGARACAFDKIFGIQRNVRAKLKESVCTYVKRSIRLRDPSKQWCGLVSACKLRHHSRLKKACSIKLGVNASALSRRRRTGRKCLRYGYKLQGAKGTNYQRRYRRQYCIQWSNSARQGRRRRYNNRRRRYSSRRRRYSSRRRRYSSRRRRYSYRRRRYSRWGRYRRRRRVQLSVTPMLTEVQEHARKLPNQSKTAIYHPTYKERQLDMA